MSDAHCHCSPLADQCPCLWPGFPPVYILNMMPHGILLASLIQLSWLCPLPALCASPDFSLAGHGKLKSP